MRKKQIAAVLISVTMLMSAFSAYAVTDSEAMERGISFGWAEEGHEAAESITRAQFAEMIVKFADVSGGNTVSSFEDISNGDERLSYINAVVDNKIITPYLNNKFDPDGVVTKQQAARAVLTVLGYSQWAEASGGYPSGYFSIALGTNMFDGVQGGATSVMTYGDIVKILANSSTIPICEPVYKSGMVIFEKNEDKTILSEKHDAYCVKGIITANDITSLTNKYAPKNCINITTNDGEVIQLNDGGKDVSNYLGYNATIYYKTINDEDTLAYVIPSTKTKELVISISDIDEYSNGTYQYFEGGKHRTVRVSKQADVIYNGKKAEDISGFEDVSYMYFPRDSKGLKKDGTIKLVSTNGTADYDLVFINAVDCYVADHYSAANNSIYLKDNKPAFDVEDDDMYDIYDIEGNEVALNTIAEWDVIEAYKSIDNEYTKYVIVRSKVEGKVTAVQKSDDDYNEAIINGNTYLYDDSCNIIAGTNSVFLLSSTGHIVMMTDEVTHDVTYGYLVKMMRDQYKDMGSAKILTMDGELVTYDLADSVKLDGVTYKEQTAMPSYINDRQLITYKLSNNQIKTIDTTHKNQSVSASDLRVIYSNMPDSAATDNEKSAGLLYKKNLNCFGGKIIVNANTKIITVPDADTSFDKYSIDTISVLKNDKNYKNLTAYTLGTDSHKADIIVQEVEGGINNAFDDDSNIAIVESIIKGINSNGDNADGIAVYINGTLQKVFGDDVNTLGKYEGDRFYPLSTGDIIRYTTNSDGIISGWQHISSGWVSGLDPIYVQSYGELEKPDSFENNIYGSDRRFACRVYDKIDNFVGVAVKSDLSQVSHENGDVVYFAADNANVYIYDKSKKKVEIGTVDDLETYTTSGDDCSDIFVSAFKGELQDVVIFK